MLIEPDEERQQVKVGRRGSAKRTLEITFACCLERDHASYNIDAMIPDQPDLHAM